MAIEDIFPSGDAWYVRIPRDLEAKAISGKNMLEVRKLKVKKLKLQNLSLGICIS
ncbi:hypothetical protein [Methanosarcina horonobensis]|uniref:hypothetical protein n=1 Tax=Methanosarcina horonobensis TaxID=418008 RepID=UPI0022B8C8CE|nr:hypothetical protein [Methanosarcina horonobensis]